MLVFGLIQAMVFAAVWWSCPRLPDHYATASIDKHERLAAAPGPRVILVGGSNVAFGYASPRFRQLGLEPVNMGLSVGLGLPFLVREVEGALRPGDVVVISPEYSLFWLPFNRDELWSLLERRPASTCLLGVDHAKGTLDHGLIFLSRKVKCALLGQSTDHEFSSLYRRSAFNAEGDFVAHYGRDSDFDVDVLEVDDRDEQRDFDVGLRALERLARRCKSVGARCYLSYPPVRRRVLEAGGETMAALHDAIESKSVIEVLGRPEEMVFDSDRFFDSGYHLNERGSAERTQRVLRYLRAEGL
jgi:hypothetical protein